MAFALPMKIGMDKDALDLEEYVGVGYTPGSTSAVETPPAIAKRYAASWVSMPSTDLSLSRASQQRTSMDILRHLPTKAE